MSDRFQKLTSPFNFFCYLWMDAILWQLDRAMISMERTRKHSITSQMLLKNNHWGVSGWKGGTIVFLIWHWEINRSSRRKGRIPEGDLSSISNVPSTWFGWHQTTHKTGQQSDDLHWFSNRSDITIGTLTRHRLPALKRQLVFSKPPSSSKPTVHTQQF